MPVSIISPTGRALQSQLQNTPPDQMQNLLNQNIGLVPFGELLALKTQYDRMKAAPAQQAMPQTTVAQDMQQGLAGVPVHNVGSEAAYARGGIVAFAGGDLVHRQNNMPYPSDEFLGPFASRTDLPPADRRLEDMNAAWTPADEAEYGQLESLRRSVPEYGISGMLWSPMRRDPEVAARKKEWEKAQARHHELALRRAQAMKPRAPGVPPPLAVAPASAAAVTETPPVSEAPNPYASMSADPSKWGGGGGLRSIVGGPVAQVSTAGLDNIMNQRREALKGGREGDIAEEMRIREQYGLGASLKDRTAQLEAKQAELDKDRKRNKRESLAQGFFRMAEAASQPGASFLGSAATGATAGLGAFQKGRDAIDKRGDDLQEKMFAVQQAKEALMEAGIAGGTKNYDAKLKAYQDAQDAFQRSKLEVDIANARARNDRGNVAATISAQRAKDAIPAMLQQRWLQLKTAGDEAGAKQVLEDYHALQIAGSPSYATGMERIDQQRLSLYMKSLENLPKADPQYLTDKLNAAKDPAAAQRVRDAEEKLYMQIFGGSAGGLPTLAPPKTPIGTSDAEIMSAAQAAAKARGW